MKIHKVEQGSAEWKQLRLGKITGSRIKEVLSSNNLGLVDKLIAEVVTEIIDEDAYVSPKMERGTDMEPLAIQYYANETGQTLDQIGFCVSNQYEWLGLSPDRLIKKDKKYKKGVEVKCPDTDTHVRYIRQNQIPNEYKGQVYNYFLVCQDLDEVDFVSYDNRFAIKPMHIVNIKRVDILKELEETEKALVKFWAKFEEYYTQVTF